jgi:multicomponent Na+:H+ antiporter subunit D
MELGTWGLPLVAIILVSSLMAVVYIWRIVEAACFGEGPDEPAAPVSVPPLLVVTLWLAAAANIYFGLVPELPLTLSGDAATDLLDHLP